MCTPPSSTIRLASAPSSSGLYGIAGHWSRLAIAPLIAQVITTGSSRLIVGERSYRDDAVALPRASYVLAGRELQRAADGGASLPRVDHVIDHVVAGGDVDVDDL